MSSGEAESTRSKRADQAFDGAMNLASIASRSDTKSAVNPWTSSAAGWACETALERRSAHEHGRCQSGGPRNRTSSSGFGDRHVTVTPVPQDQQI